MRIKRAEANNFASYRELAFEFTEAGLNLIQGPTGSGKSTFCDLVPWILFGRTAKGGTVDEIRSWNCKESTTGTILFSLSDGEWEVIRQRGKANDLAFRRAGASDLSRGKDISDTQRLLNEKLGMDFDLYLASSYYHEFSNTATFFTTTPKNRRLICEQLVDLSLAVKLKEEIKLKEKEVRNESAVLQTEVQSIQTAITTLKRVEEKERTRASDWESNHLQYFNSLTSSIKAFEEGRKKTAQKRCPTCKRALEAVRDLYDDSPNPYASRLEELKKEVNPYTKEAKSYKKEIEEKASEVKVLNKELEYLATQLSELDELADVADAYRSAAISNTIQFVQDNTNELLSTFFDAEIRVNFEVEAADKLNVTLSKDGNTAAFTQLSKGQRQMLKLCFGVAVMKAVQNHHNISQSQIYFDECLDGLDERTKLKALRLLETLTQSYETVFIVEHSESLKSMVNQKYSVELINGESIIGKAE